MRATLPSTEIFRGTLLTEGYENPHYFIVIADLCMTVSQFDIFRCCIPPLRWHKTTEIPLKSRGEAAALGAAPLLVVQACRVAAQVVNVRL